VIKIYFPTHSECSLCESDNPLFTNVKAALLNRADCKQATNPDEADAIMILEENSFKEWRYITRLIKDPLIGRYPHKTYTINTDDCASGLLRGVYTSLPKNRYDLRIHQAVPYAFYPNEIVLKRNGNNCEKKPDYLGSWRGNTKSHKIRKRLVDSLSLSPVFLVETSDSWLNHSENEKEHYVDLILSSKFSLCPAGWAATTFRIYESMALGVSPVIIADDFVAPDGPDWDTLSIKLPERDVLHLEAVLRKSEPKYADMGRLAYIAWERYFSPDVVFDYYAKAIIQCIKNSDKESCIKQEIKRWKSFKMYWSNRWTLFQRLQIKLNKLMCS
jgi:hypothetical protein